MSLGGRGAELDLSIPQYLGLRRPGHRPQVCSFSFLASGSLLASDRDSFQLAENLRGREQARESGNSLVFLPVNFQDEIPGGF